LTNHIPSITLLESDPRILLRTILAYLLFFAEGGATPAFPNASTENRTPCSLALPLAVD
jgi:hypothetical protein